MSAIIPSTISEREAAKQQQVILLIETSIISINLPYVKKVEVQGFGGFAFSESVIFKSLVSVSYQRSNKMNKQDFMKLHVLISSSSHSTSLKIQSSNYFVAADVLCAAKDPIQPVFSIPWAIWSEYAGESMVKGCSMRFMVQRAFLE
ncbi:hypothetical protein LXL04_033992 [Taraxacum kok-saghyz]